MAGLNLMNHGPADSKSWPENREKTMSLVDEIREDLGVHLDLKVNCRSDDKPEIQACVAYQFGVNKMPTHAEVDVAIDECIIRFNEAAGVSDGRLSNMSDWGFAETGQLGWECAK